MLRRKLRQGAQLPLSFTTVTSPTPPPQHQVHHPVPPPLEKIGIDGSIPSPQIFPIHLQKHLAGKNVSLLALLEQSRPISFAPIYSSSFKEKTSIIVYRFVPQNKQFFRRIHSEPPHNPRQTSPPEHPTLPPSDHQNPTQKDIHHFEKMRARNQTYPRPVFSPRQ